MAQGRRVRRVVRRIDPWSVLKVSLLFTLTLVLVLLLAGVLLWMAGSAVGAVGSVESFIETLGFKDFEFVAGQLLRGFVAGGLVIVVMGTGTSVLMAVLYNLISDVVGGIELTVLEEAFQPAPAPAHDGAVARTGPVPAPAPTPLGVSATTKAADERVVAPGYPA
ncbi:MAG TPA: DUF3566 domain-containing protein [Acidimicrobiales bacterium]|nr:DUF3566 domain-containing protein [Acidimicrobiales bacterium]